MRPDGSTDSDGAMGRALEAGLPTEHLAVLMAARRSWWADNAGVVRRPPDPLTGEAAAAIWAESLDAALAHPAAVSFDAVFVAAMRRDRGLR